VLNAVNLDLATALLGAVRSIQSNPTIRVVLMRGNGRAFMAGGDIATFDQPPEHRAKHFSGLMDAVHAAMEILMGLDQPVVASVHGAVAGAGISVAMAADLVIASEETRFTMGYTKLGVSADGSISWSLPRLVGLRKALEMALLSDVYDAPEALRLGLINKVFAANTLEAETECLVRRLSEGPTVAFGKMKRLMRQSDGRTLPEQLRAEEAALFECIDTQDFASGVRASLNKTRTDFVGK